MGSRDGVWGLNITKVGREDAGVYVCQTDDPDRGTVAVTLNIKGKEDLQGDPSGQLQPPIDLVLTVPAAHGSLL